MIPILSDDEVERLLNRSRLDAFKSAWPQIAGLAAVMLAIAGATVVACANVWETDTATVIVAVLCGLMCEAIVQLVALIGSPALNHGLFGGHVIRAVTETKGEKRIWTLYYYDELFKIAVATRAYTGVFGRSKDWFLSGRRHLYWVDLEREFDDTSGVLTAYVLTDFFGDTVRVRPNEDDVITAIWGRNCVAECPQNCIAPRLMVA